MKRALSICIATAALWACSESDGDDGSGGTGGASSCESFTAGLTQLGDEGAVSIVLESSEPAPPARGNNDWTIQLLDTASVPISDATVSITPFMPKHGHGSSVPAVITPLGDGRYELNPVNFPMSGVWEVTVDVALAGGGTDKTMFTFCVAD
jgi:hypothetical protein